MLHRTCWLPPPTTSPAQTWSDDSGWSRDSTRCKPRDCCLPIEVDSVDARRACRLGRLGPHLVVGLGSDDVVMQPPHSRNHPQDIITRAQRLLAGYF